MIEMRRIVFSNSTQEILQYRHRLPTMETLVDAYPPRDWQWSEWQNAPSVDIRALPESEQKKACGY